MQRVFHSRFPFHERQVGRAKVSIPVFQANVKLFPKEANPYDSLAEAYLKDGQKDKALAYYKKALEIDPDFPSAKAAMEELKQ